MNVKYIPIFKRLCLALVILIACQLSLQATHIVGGEMNYTCLGNDNYEIELTIYRDCFYADPAAFFDDPAYIGVFNSNNVLVGNLSLPLLNNDTIPAILNDSCLFVPADVCVHTTTYRGTINLPFIQGGYQLAYERCCRNETILNIVDPLNAGAIYNVIITEEALLGCNNSAKFTEWPPLFVCINEPIDWDHSAFDADGDSLVYELGTPLTGGTQANPKPVPTNNPPYDEVVWNEPAFGLDNLLGGEALTIDRHTGRLTAIPAVMGQFVVGIFVSEYRNGVLISRSHRDFQYNVGECGEVESVIVAPQVQCEDLSVSFTNESLNGDGFLWSFNDPNNPGATSTEREPTYQYSEPGTYTIELIASTRSVCKDTSYHTIFLQNNSMTADFNVDVKDCVENSTIILTDLSSDPISDPANWSWSVKLDGSEIATSNEQNPTFQVSPGQIEVALTTTSENGCVDGSASTFATVINDPGDQIASDITVCKENETSLNPGADPSYTYQWAPNSLFTDLSSPNPIVNIASPASLEVTITNSDGSCSNTKLVNLNVTEIPEISGIADEHTICEGEVVSFNLIEYPDLDFQWTGPGLDNPSSDTPTAAPSESALYNLTVSQTGSFGCTADLNIAVRVNDNPEEQLASIPDQTSICGGESASLNPNADINFEYTWTGSGLNNVTIQNPIVGPSESGSYEVVVTNPSTGCTLQKSVSVFIPADIDLNVEGDRDICFNEGTNLQAQGVGNLSFEWRLPDGTIVSEESMLSFNDNSSTDFQLIATNVEGCRETQLVSISVSERIDALDNLPDSVLVCENVPTALSNVSNNQYNFLWTPNIHLDDNTTSIPVFTAEETTIYTVEALDQNTGCKVEKFLKAVVPQRMNLVVSDDMSSCGDDPIELSAFSSTAEGYTWISENGASIGTSATVSVDPRTSANYIVEAVDEFGCFVVDSVRVNFVGIEANIADAQLETCDDEVQLELSDINPNNINSYQWGPLESILSGENSANPIVINDTNDPILFSVTVTNDKGCIAMDEVELNNRFDLDALDTGIDACADADLELNPDFNSDYSYEWGPASLLDDPTSPNPSYIPTGDQLFTVTITDDEGCTTLREVQVTTVDLNDMVTIDLESDTILSGESTQLDVTFNSDFTYLWIPPTSLDNNTVSNPIASPTETTNYSVMITNSQGCIATKTITLTVLSSECAEPFIFFPNAFTPNGDGINDVLRVRGNALSEVRYVIYNRWGEKMYEGNSVDDEWDGTYKGKKLAPDVYGFYLEAKCIFGGEYKKQGNVTILE